MMLMTPPIASEPYCAAAPSRSTSMRSMLAAGIAFRSTPVEPRPIELFTATTAPACRRFPLISTSAWSGPSPRSVKGRCMSTPPAIDVRGKFTLGTSICRIWLVSVRPVCLISAEVTTSMGTGASVTERSVARRDPVTATALSTDAARVSWKFCVTVPPAATVTFAFTEV
jgi:hypothetical protein